MIRKVNPKTQKRSPIRQKPLRVPGQSLDEQIHDYIVDRIYFWLTMGLVFAFWVVNEWLRWLHPSQPWPKLTTVLMTPAIAFCGWRIWKSLPTLRQLQLARDGERTVGQALERLRADGHHILHDIPGDGFNLDHVIIGPRGIYTIETKTHSKNSTSKVTFGPNGLLVDGFTPDRDPLAQARAQADWLRNLLHECTSEKHAIQPVVLYPGWFIDPMPADRKDVWVLNEKSLPSFLQYVRPYLAPAKARAIAFQLENYVRTRATAEARPLPPQHSGVRQFIASLPPGTRTQEDIDRELQADRDDWN